MPSLPPPPRLTGERPMPALAGVEHRHVDLPGVRVHVAEAGSGPPLVLLTAGPSTGGSGVG